MTTSHIVSVDPFIVRGALKPIAVKKGDTIQVELRESASTGYLWTSHSDHISHVRDIFEEEEKKEDGEEGVVGAPRNRTMVFTAAKSDELVLEYRRPWETTRANKLLTLKITVEA